MLRSQSAQGQTETWECAGNLGTNSVDLIKYFQGYKGVSPIPEKFNPATWMLQAGPLTLCP